MKSRTLRNGVRGPWPRLVQGGALALLLAVPTQAQEIGSLHEQIAAALAGPSTAPPWLIVPAITVRQEWTDNASQTTGSAKPQASFITVLVPSLAISGATSRVTANVYYAPSLSHYSSVSGQDRVSQNLNATVKLSLIPDQLFLDLRGFAAQQSLGGATAPAGTVALSRQNEVQTYSFSASPYLNHRFGGWGTAQVGVAVSQTSQGALAGSQGNSPFVNGQSNGLASQDVNTRQEFASFASGENFGRLLSNVNLSASQSSGTGALQGAHRNTASYQAGYAITHGIVALASVGWEDIAYAGVDPLRIDDATWSVGGRLSPRPDSTVTLLYGHQNGVTAASLDASYALTPRTHLYASYLDGVSTDTEQLQNALTNAQLDPLGNPVNAQTGAPVLLTDNFFGVTGTVYRVRNLSVTASWLLDRDAVQATVRHQEQTPIGAAAGIGQVAAGGAAVASQGSYGSLAWEHEVNAALRSNVFFQYGKLSQSFGGGHVDTDLLVGSAALTYQLSETLSGSLEYSYTSNSYAAQVAGTAANLVVLGVRKSF